MSTRTLRINSSMIIDDRDFEERFVRASGPGGQNVNKVSSAVELRFNVKTCSVLPVRAQSRLIRLAGRRMTEDGVLVIRAERYRTQDQNRTDARARLAALIRQSLISPKARIPTQPSNASRQRRLDAKSRRSNIKRLRRVRPHS